MIQAELLWDDETIEHIWERHRLSIEEVDEAFHDPKHLSIVGRVAVSWFMGKQRVEDI